MPLCGDAELKYLKLCFIVPVFSKGEWRAGSGGVGAGGWV